MVPFFFGCHAVGVTARQRRFLDRVVATLEAENVDTFSAVDLARALGTPIQAVEEIVRIGASDGALLVLEGGVLYSPGQISAIGERVGAALGGRVFTIREFRESLGTTRKYADALLAHFEHKGLVERTPDGRRWRGQA
jgi:selenocysteine-specific elongation factor